MTMRPAARRDEQTRHGGQLLNGSGTVTIGRRPAARILDAHWCPRHGEGYVKSGSRTVFINSRRAARKEDLCDCETIRLAYGDLVRLDSDGDGTDDTVIAMIGLARSRQSTYVDLGLGELGIQDDMDALYGQFHGRATTDSEGMPGFGVLISGDAGVWRQGLGLSWGPAGDQGQNPSVWLNAQVDFLHIGANMDLLVGDDGTRQGLGFVFAGGIDLLSITVSGGQTLSIPFTPLTLEINPGLLFGPPPSMGIGWGLQAYRNKEDGRFYFYGLTAVAPVLFKAGGFFGISIGPKRSGGGVGPNDIKDGSRYVLVGG